MQAIRACVAATVRRDLKEPVAPVERSHEERVAFRWRRFLLLTYLVVTASTAQFVSDDSGRNSREETTGSTGDKKSTPLGESGTTGAVRKGKYRNQKPSPTVIPATIDRDLDPCKRPPTGGWAMRISDCPHPIEQRAFRENCIPGMDGVSVMWSPLESNDGPGRHSGKDWTDNRSTSTDTSLPRMCIGDATTTDDKQNGDVLRMQSVSFVQKSGAHISHYGTTCFAVCALVFSSSAHGRAGDGTGFRFSWIGSVPAEPAVTQQQRQFLLEQLRHLSHSGITGQEARRAIVRMFPGKQQKIKVNKAVRTLQDTMQRI